MTIDRIGCAAIALFCSATVGGCAPPYRFSDLPDVDAPLWISAGRPADVGLRSQNYKTFMFTDRIFRHPVDSSDWKSSINIGRRSEQFLKQTSAWLDLDLGPKRRIPGSSGLVTGWTRHVIGLDPLLVILRKWPTHYNETSRDSGGSQKHRDKPVMPPGTDFTHFAHTNLPYGYESGLDVPAGELWWCAPELGLPPVKLERRGDDLFIRLPSGMTLTLQHSKDAYVLLWNE